MKDLLITIVIAVVLFELLEHVALPLIGLVVRRRRKSRSGIGTTVGQVVEVREWDKTEGLVFLRGELWKAESDVPLAPGQKAVIRGVRGLILIVESMPASPHE